MKREFSAGGIVFNDQGQVLLTQNSSNLNWGFPKGWIDKGESSKDAAIREVKEEGGVNAEIIEKVGDSKFVFTDIWNKHSEDKKQEGEKVFKVVTYYLMKYVTGDTKDHDFEVAEAEWFSIDEALKKLSFASDKNLLKKAVKMYGQ